MMATVEEGTEVIIPAPYWVSYPDMVVANGGTPVVVPCGEDVGFKLTPAALEAAITPATRWVVLNSPSNPTGAAYTAAELRALADVLLRHPQVLVMCDEIYDRIWYADFKTESILGVAPELDAQALVVNGVSKSYAMTGLAHWLRGGTEISDRRDQQAAITDVILSLLNQSGCRCRSLNWTAGQRRSFGRGLPRPS